MAEVRESEHQLCGRASSDLEAVHLLAPVERHARLCLAGARPPNSWKEPGARRPAPPVQTVGLGAFAKSLEFRGGESWCVSATRLVRYRPLPSKDARLRPFPVLHCARPSNKVRLRDTRAREMGGDSQHRKRTDRKSV